MSVAVVTFVYDEAVNLPIWLRYYGKLFGEKNLFVVDHSSRDGSTNDIGQASKILIPRDVLEENKRSVFMASFHTALLAYFDTVIYTDCDEIIVADPGKHRDLADYIANGKFERATPIGLDIQHMPALERPLDLSQPILAQRQYCRLNIGMCKTLISRVPIIWETGFHASNKPISMDDSLFLFHLKLMDFDIAMQRVKFTREMGWSERSLAAGHGAHARYDDERFKREFFSDPQNILKTQGLSEFEFSSEIARVAKEMRQLSGFYLPPQLGRKIMLIPERFRTLF